MLLDNDFLYISQKKILNPTNSPNMKKVFPHFCRYFYYRYRSITLLYHDAPMDRRRRSAFQFSTERALEK
jgi:hypothetical protein